MTDQTTEAESSTATARPVRVPNVSPGAVSGLGHEVIGLASGEVYDAEASYADDQDELVAQDPAPRVEGTQAYADPASSLTGSGTPEPSDPTNGALPTGIPTGETTDTYTVGDYTVEQVNDYLDKYPAATAEVLAAEADGKARVGILHGRHGTPETD